MTEEQIREAAVDARRIALDQHTATRAAARTIGASQDRTVISLSGGALVFSMTLVGTFAPAKLLLPVLIVSWSAFVLSIIAVVFAMRREQLAIHDSLKQIAALLTDIDKAEATAIASKGEFRVRLDVSKDSSVEMLNNLALAGFLIGVILLGFFVGYNLWLG